MARDDDGCVERPFMDQLGACNPLSGLQVQSSRKEMIHSSQIQKTSALLKARVTMCGF